MLYLHYFHDSSTATTTIFKLPEIFYIKNLKMVNWWLIAALLIVGLILAKARHLKHKFLAVLVVLLILFFYLTIPKVIAGKDINIKTFDGIMMTAKLYFAWLVHSFGNIRTLTGQAIEMDWVGNQSRDGGG